MNEHCDILIIGAGTAGIYFGWQMARRGHSVVIVERSERLAVGKRLDVFHVDSVKFAEILATVPSAANATKQENSYLFEKDVIFSEQDLTDMNRDFEMHLTTRKILKIVGVIVLGLLTGHYSLASLKALLKSVRISGRIRAHYESFPEDPDAFGLWVAVAEDLWSQANPRMS
jgi:choline dehydrogenase-like flavoprotein